MKYTAVILILVLLASCADPGDAEHKGVIYDSLAPYRDSLENKITATDTARVLSIDAYNSECQVIEDSMVFRQAIHIAKNDLGFVRVRSDASCFDVENCLHNLLGTIKDDQWVWSYGAVKYKNWSAGLAYVICVRDSKGRLVKGYISATVLEEPNRPY